MVFVPAHTLIARAKPNNLRRRSGSRFNKLQRYYRKGNIPSVSGWNVKTGLASHCDTQRSSLRATAVFASNPAKSTSTAFSANPCRSTKASPIRIAYAINAEMNRLFMSDAPRSLEKVDLSPRASSFSPRPVPPRRCSPRNRTRGSGSCCCPSATGPMTRASDWSP